MVVDKAVKDKLVVDFEALRGLSREIISLSGDIVSGLNGTLPKLVQTVTMESIVISHADARREIFYANEAFIQMTGYTLDEVIGRNCSLLQGPLSDPKVIDEMRVSLNAFQPVRVELVNYKKDGTPFINEISIFPVFRAEGSTPFCFVGVQNPRPYMTR